MDYVKQINEIISILEDATESVVADSVKVTVDAYGYLKKIDVDKTIKDTKDVDLITDLIIQAQKKAMEKVNTKKTRLVSEFMSEGISDVVKEID